MTSKIGVEISLVGLTGTNSYTGQAHPSPLFIPIESELDIRPGYVETTAPTVGTDPNVTVFNNVAAYPVLLGLGGGAWQEFHDVNTRKYFEPYHSRPTSGATTTIVQPLLWTRDPVYPLMVGCEHKTTEDAAQHTFDQYINFRDKLYALDKTNNKLWKLPSNDSAWVDITPSYTTPGTLTQLWADSRGLKLVCGTQSNKAHYVSIADPVAATWAAYTPVGSHYVTYGNDTFYVSLSGSNYAVLKRNASVTKKQIPQYVGEGLRNVTNILWADGYIVLTKPEGVFVVEPKRKQGAQLPLLPFPSVATNNGQVLFLHGREVFFSAVDGGFYSWNIDSGAILARKIARFTGIKRRPFLNGRVLAGESDGQRIYLVYRVERESDDGAHTVRDHYLLIGDGENWHPVHVVSSYDSNIANAAVHFENNRLRYSMGGKSGYLRTDGEQPISAASGSFTYSTDSAPVGITTGWIDAGRDWLQKWWWKLMVSQRDRGATTIGVGRFYYQKWGQDPDTWTLIGSTAGNQDNAELAFAEESGSVGISDVVTSKIMLRADLRKSDSTENDKAHYLASLHLVGLPFYDPAFRVVFTVYFDIDGLEHKTNGRSYVAGTVYAALLAAQAQAEPLKITLPDGRSFYGTILPSQGGIEILDSDKDTGAPRRYRATYLFQEHA